MEFKRGRVLPTRDFSIAARAELARIWPSEAHCACAELAGILRASGSLHLHGQRLLSLSITTEHADVARKVVKLLRKVAALASDVVVEEHEQLGKHRAYRVHVRPGPEVKRLLGDLGLLSAGGQLLRDVPPDLVRKSCCRAAFLRGAYMMRGSVSDPRGSSYHLEIVAATEEFGLGLCYLLNLFHFKGHLGERKEQPLVYLKDADDIAGFLSMIGAHQARLELEEVRVVKEVRGGVNRLVNAETANMDKAVVAALEQVGLIETLREAGLLSRLPAAVREAAEARLNFPEATLAELGRSLPRPISKSAINDRLRRLKRYAQGDDEIREIYRKTFFDPRRNAPPDREE